MPASPVNAEVALVGVVTEPPAPEMIVHAPVPIVGALPAKVTEVPQTVWSEPALAAVGGALTITEIGSDDAVQGALLIVHWKT